MDKRLIFAVAGSGKTYYIVQQLDQITRSIIITYTISGTENLRNEVISRFGYVPSNIKILNFFSFLYSFCYKPYLSDEIKEKGISWKYPKSEFDQNYITKFGYLYHNRISKLIITKVIEEVRARLEKYYDNLYIDEVHDFGGNDFNFIAELTKSKLKMLFVGDFNQHTFDTSRDKQTNKSLHKDINTFISKFLKLGIKFDPNTLVKSRRCSKSTCNFIKSRLGINIEAENDLITQCRLVTDIKEVKQIFGDDTIVKLFLQRHYDYNCCSNNWAACKGLTYENVCVIINNDTQKLFNSSGVFNFKSNITKNKFYVACSRAKKDLYFVPANLVTKYKKTKFNQD